MKPSFRNRKILSFVIIALSFFSLNIQAERLSDDDKNTKKFIANETELNPIFERLSNLETNKTGKINIVHIGDSHIQADFFTNIIREILQEKFGNGGYGLTFPYRLARTNGTRTFKYSSEAIWRSRLNVSPIASEFHVGLSGIGLCTEESNFAIHFSSEKYPFSSVKIIYSTQDPQYNVSLKDSPVVEIKREKIEDTELPTHKISRGESLSIIAAKYDTTVKDLKEENDLESDYIQAGWVIKIPPSTKSKRYKEKITRTSPDYESLQTHPYYSSFVSASSLNKISIFPRDNTKDHNINGLVFENNNPGLLYHAIGVNGAKISDFNKFPLFFKQLAILQPDLVILSFGTNESYQKLTAERYIAQIRKIIKELKSINPDVAILVMTPPPSMMRRRNTNTLIKQYSQTLMKLTDIPVWDLYERMDGEKGILTKGKFSNLIARDKIHYSEEGYKIQAEMFAADFLEAYKHFKDKRED